MPGLLEYCDNELVATALLHKELDAFRQVPKSHVELSRSLPSHGFRVWGLGFGV